MSAKTDNKLLWKFIYKTFLLVLLPTLLFLAAYEIAYRNIPNSYSLKKEYLDRCADSIDLLILGSSHSFYGINPEYFTYNTFNAANVSQSLDYDAKIYDTWFKGKAYPRYVVLPISYFTLWGRVSLGIEHWRTRKYSIYMGFGSWRDWFSPDGYEFQLGDRTVVGYYFFGGDKKDCTKSGFGTAYICSPGKDVDESAITAATRHTIKGDRRQIYEENMSYINDMLLDCRKFGKKVVFLISPYRKLYREALPPVQVRRTHEVLDSLHAAYPDNTAILNLSSDPRFAAADFYDGDHLCTDGAAKLSVILNDTLPKVFNRIP